MPLQQVFSNARLQVVFEIRQIQDKTVILMLDIIHMASNFLLNQLRKFLKYNKQYTDVVAVFSMLADKHRRLSPI